MLVPQELATDIKHLTSDIQGFADELGRQRFHLVGLDWGAFLGWVAARHPDRAQSLSAVSTAHPDAFLDAFKNDDDQKQRSRNISFFRMPDGAAESFFQADNYQRLRAVYLSTSRQRASAPEKTGRAA